MMTALSRLHYCQKCDITPVPNNKRGLEEVHKLGMRQQCHTALEWRVTSAHRHRAGTCQCPSFVLRKALAEVLPYLGSVREEPVEKGRSVSVVGNYLHKQMFPF